jgi:uncharacterized 2Fe-2S/4Fe-4S cluster protein (DUF4445 family)
MKSYPITIRPGERVIVLPEGANLFEGLRRQGVYIYNACGGEAKCGKCKVRLTGSSLAPTAEEAACLTPQEIADGFRLSCCIEVHCPLELEIPEPALPAASLTAESCLPPLSPRPAVRKSLINTPVPSLKDNAAYLERIEGAAGSAFHPWHLKENLTHLHSLLKNPPPKLTAVLIDRKLAWLEAGDTTAACYAVAVDIGTTMVDASVIDLNLGREVATLSALNPQIAYGMDVLSRISSCQDSQLKVRELQQLIIKRINSLLKQFADTLDISRKSIYQLAVVGNPTMLHLFAGVNPRSIGRAPYVPVFSRGLQFKPADCGIEISPGGEVFLLPSVSAYIGADIVAGMLVAGLPESTRPAIFIDLGTNGEVVLAADHKLLATSCAAGPALEGMNISCGMPALPGAIERVFFNQELEFRTIGGGPPQGLCGSAVIDLAAEMIRCGVVDNRGRFKGREELLPGEHPWLAQYVAEIGGEPTLVLYQDKQCRVHFSQTDFRQIQLARGAICSAMEVLLTEAGLKMPDIKRFILAGRFGKSIRAESFKHLGVIPAGFAGQLDYIGNSAKTGAMMTLINSGYRQETERLCRNIATIELSTYPGYERILVKHLALPALTKEEQRENR